MHKEVCWQLSFKVSNTEDTFTYFTSALHTRITGNYKLDGLWHNTLSVLSTVILICWNYVICISSDTHMQLQGQLSGSGWHKAALAWRSDRLKSDSGWKKQKLWECSKNVACNELSE